MKRVTGQWHIGKQGELLPRVRFMVHPGDMIGVGLGWLWGWLHVWVWVSAASKARERAHARYLASDEFKRQQLEELLSDKCWFCKGTGKKDDEE